MKQIERKLYLNQLLQWRCNGHVKIVTGIRRGGKTTLMRQFVAAILADGETLPEQIININFEEIRHTPLQEYHALRGHIVSRLQGGRQNYVILDEVLMVRDFHKTLNSLAQQPNVDIYLTSSNASLNAEDTMALLHAPVDSMCVMPLSVAEFATAMQLPPEQAYEQYVRSTSLPYVLTLNNDPESTWQYLQGVYHTIVFKDVMSRGKVQDAELLDWVIRIVAESVGQLTTYKTIADVLTDSGRKTSSHTIDNYLQMLCDSYIFHRVDRVDIRSKEVLRMGHKYYITDPGMRNMMFGLTTEFSELVLENVVYLELIRRGYSVAVGRLGNKEIDFVCQRGEQTLYVQAAVTVADERALQRELSPLQEVQDNFPKLLITTDPAPQATHDGIVQANLAQWLVTPEQEQPLSSAAE